jgi:hypothetical protein
VSTTIITVVLLENYIDMWSCELCLCATSSEAENEVIPGQVEGISKVTEEEN